MALNAQQALELIIETARRSNWTPERGITCDKVPEGTIFEDGVNWSDDREACWIYTIDRTNGYGVSYRTNHQPVVSYGPGEYV